MHKKLMLIKQDLIEQKIFLIRDKEVMLDRDLASLYEVNTKILNQAVKRNIQRFPEDFMFRLNKRETAQLVTNCDRFKSLKHSSHFPNAFTEHGILMLSSVLNSERAIEVNIQIMRTFTKLRELMVVHKDLREKIESMERKYDGQFQAIFQAIRRLIDPPVRKLKIPFGFHVPKKSIAS